MSLKLELQQKLQEFGYELGPFASKDTLSAVLCLHAVVMQEKNINVARLDDLDLRKRLTHHGLLVGPVTNHTRAVYQRKLLEVLTNRTTEGAEDDQSEEEEEVPLRRIDRDTHQKNTLYPDLPIIKSRPPTKSTGSNSKNTKSSDIRHDCKASPSSRDTYGEPNEIRARVSTKPDEPQTPLKVEEKLQVATKSSGTYLYAGITISVALVVFVLYLWLV